MSVSFIRTNSSPSAAWREDEKDVCNHKYTNGIRIISKLEARCLFCRYRYDARLRDALNLGCQSIRFGGHI